ncbi:MAG: nitronate monooxygenase [Fimbriimonadaceae bacterium]
MLGNPLVIQGGMGVAVSSWPLARAVSLRGQLGVVSGTALDAVLARRLQLGDVGGHIAEAMSKFPVRAIAERVWDRYFIPGGKAANAPFKSKPLPQLNATSTLVELTVLANFVEVYLAKRGHSGAVGINLLEKIQTPTLPSLFGAMLAGVDAVLMGAGIPRYIPRVLDELAEGRPSELRIDVSGLDSDQVVATRFDPAPHLTSDSALNRPKFLAIVSSASLAQVLAKKCSPGADGFIIEGPTAGGHNAPPRGALQLNKMGEPLYGERDVPEFSKINDLGLPYWIAGSYGTREKLLEAQDLGARGIQVGTAFAFCDESGILPEIRAEVLQASITGKTELFTDPLASPTGFPFKVLKLPGTVGDPTTAEKRDRICDLGYLRELYMQPNGKVGYRCAAEPVEDYVRKGGSEENTEGRVCICNGLVATVGMAQSRNGHSERALVTAGDDVANLGRYLKPGKTSYSADDVLDVLLPS